MLIVKTVKKNNSELTVGDVWLFRFLPPVKFYGICLKRNFSLEITRLERTVSFPKSEIFHEHQAFFMIKNSYFVVETVVFEKECWIHCKNHNALRFLKLILSGRHIICVLRRRETSFYSKEVKFMIKADVFEDCIKMQNSL